MKGLLIFSSRLSLAFGLKLLNLGFQIVTIILIAKVFTEKELGIYYLMLSLFGLQIISDFGFSKTMAIFISHDSGKVTFENKILMGPKTSLNRVNLVFHLVINWLKKAFLVLFVIYLALGAFFFLYKDNSVELFKLWIPLALISSFSIFSPLIFSFFEGINNINRANIFISTQLIVSNVFFLLSINKLGIYSILIKSLGGLIVLLLYIYHYRKLFKQLINFEGEENQLRNQFNIQQKKFALTSITGYFILNTFVPFSYYFISSEFSGKLGFSLQIVNTLISFLMIFFLVNYPIISQDIAERKYHIARSKFYYILKLILPLYFFGAICFFATKDNLLSFINSKFLTTNQLILLFAGGVFFILVQLMGSYLRLFKKEFFLKHAFISALLSITLLSTIGYHYSEKGVVASYIIITFFQLSYGYLIFKKHLHHETN